MKWKLFCSISLTLYAGGMWRVTAAETLAGLASCNVVWNSAGNNFKDSMPIGNGDLGLNVWTEQNAEPDRDNGGAGQLILHNMLLQIRGDKLLLFPAWPKEWDVDFKLHAPQNTIIQGVYHNPKIEQLEVTPKSRAKEVIQLPPQ